MNAFVDVFWSKGYNATSIDDLQDVAGIKRGSFYAAFGSKDEVFQSVLERYWNTVTEPGLTCLEQNKSALDGIADFVRHAGRSMSENSARGCLLLSSAPLSSTPPKDYGAVKERMTRLEQRLKDRLTADPVLAASGTDRIETIWAYILTVLMGLNAMARAGHDADAIRRAADLAASTLQSL